MMNSSESGHGVLTFNGEVKLYDTSDQEIVEVKDREGHSIKHHVFNGVLNDPLFAVAYLKQIRGFKMRPDDCYLIGHMRTGTHWTYERIAMLLNGNAETIEKYKDQLEFLPASHFDCLSSPRIIHTHIRLSDAPEEVVTKKCRVVYTMRDPKDVIVSMYNFRYNRALPSGTYRGSFAAYLQLALQGSVLLSGIFDHCRDAEKFIEDHSEIPTYIHYYEDSEEDPVRAVHELSDFLGLQRDDALCQLVANKCDFSKMRVDKDKFSAKLDGESFLFRQGTSGDWKNWFTDELLDEYYKVYENKMAGTRFYHRYSREATCS